MRIKTLIIILVFSFFLLPKGILAFYPDKPIPVVVPFDGATCGSSSHTYTDFIRFVDGSGKEYVYYTRYYDVNNPNPIDIGLAVPAGHSNDYIITSTFQGVYSYYWDTNTSTWIHENCGTATHIQDTNNDLDLLNLFYSTSDLYARWGTTTYKDFTGYFNLGSAVQGGSLLMSANWEHEDFPINIMLNVPTISNLDPIGVFKTGGQWVKITGTNFGEDSVVKMCGETASIVSQSNTEIKFISVATNYQSCQVSIETGGLSVESRLIIIDGTVANPVGDETTINYQDLPSIIDDPSGFVAGMFYNLGQWVKYQFVPQQDQFLYLGVLMENMTSTTIPFSYFTLIKTTINQFTLPTETQGNTDLAFSIPVGNGSMQMPFFSSSNSDVKEFADGIRPYLVAGMWITFALYLFDRSRYFGSDG